MDSIFLHLFVFLISIIPLLYLGKSFYYANENVIHIQQKGYILLSLSIVLLCGFAALRDTSVGTDIGVYVLPNFNRISHSGFWHYYVNMPVNTEIGFAYVLYLGVLFDDIGVSFFLMQFLTILPVLFLLCKKQYYSTVVGMLIFLFLNYDMSLSMMRGSIAMSILLLAYSYLYEEKYKIFLILTGLAVLFHSSTLLIAPILFAIHKMCQTSHFKLLIVVYLSIIGIFYVVASKYSSTIGELAGFANERYTHYVEKYMEEGNASDIPLTDLVCKSLILVISLIVFHKSNNPLVREYLLLAFTGRFFVLFNGVFYESMRIAFFFDMFLIPLVAMIPNSLYKTKFEQKTMCFTAIAFAFAYWIHFVMGIGAYGTNVYEFR